MEISLCGPQSFQPDEPILKLLKDNNLSPTWTFTSDPDAGAVGADAVYTDVWVSMGCEEESQARLQAMQPLPGKRLHLQLNQRELSFHALYAPPILKRKSPSLSSIPSGRFFLTRRKIVSICKRQFYPRYPRIIPEKMKLILAYSGGLDTSVLVHWFAHHHGAEVITYCADVGQEEELDGLEEKAMAHRSTSPPHTRFGG